MYRRPNPDCADHIQRFYRATEIVVNGKGELVEDPVPLATVLEMTDVSDLTCCYCRGEVEEVEAGEVD